MALSAYWKMGHYNGSTTVYKGCLWNFVELRNAAAYVEWGEWSFRFQLARKSAPECLFNVREEDINNADP